MNVEESAAYLRLKGFIVINHGEYWAFGHPDKPGLFPCRIDREIIAYAEAIVLDDELSKLNGPN